MQVSLQWLQEFVEIQEPPDVLADVLTNLGLEVEEWHHFVGQHYREQEKLLNPNSLTRLYQKG